MSDYRAAVVVDMSRSDNPTRTRIDTIGERIKRADRFPRIRDAEIKMKEYEEKWQKKKARRAKELKLKGNLNALDQRITEDLDQPDMFSEHVLNKDPKLSASLTYDALYYPMAFGHQKRAPESIDRFWLSAYIDRAERDAGILKKERERDLFASIKDYTPDGSQGKSMSAQDADSNISAGAAPASITSSEIQTKRSDSKIQANIRQSNLIRFTAESGVDDLSSEGRSIRGTSTDGDISVSGSMLEDSLSLTQPSLTGAQITAAVNDDPNEKIKRILLKKAMGKKPRKDTVEDKLQPYNNALKAIVMSKMKKVVEEEPHSIVSLDLDKLFEHERVENEAANRIAKTWKRYKIMPKLHFAVRAMLHAVHIQKLVRGILTRKRVARYFSFMTVLATWTQAHIRRYLSNKVWRPYLAMEKMCAIRIQKVLRGKFGRNRWIRARKDLAATRIQALWRGIGARTKSDIRWLGKTVTPVQCAARKFLTKRKILQVKNEIYPAADKIQRCYRAYFSKRRVADKLFEREMHYREDVITNLQSEEEWVQEKLEKVVKRFTKNNLKAEAIEVFKKCEESYEQVYMDQNMYVEINRQMEILSPRAIAQGWFLELTKKAYFLRNDLTQKKITCIFQDLAKVLNTDEKLERAIKEIEDISEWRIKLGKQRDWEYLERRERFYYRDLRARRKKERRAVADERRKWEVKFFTGDGKPDKRRRPGKPWDASIFSKPEKMTYSAVDGVHLFANELNSKKSFKPGSVESVDATMGKMALQTYLDQVNHYEQILNPIGEIMRKFIAPAPEVTYDQRTGRPIVYNENITGRGSELERELSDAQKSTEIVAWDLVPERKLDDASVSNSKGFGLDDDGSQWSSVIDGSPNPRDISSSKSEGSRAGSDNGALVLGRPKNYGLVTKKEQLRREEAQKERERKMEETRRLEEAIRLRQERSEARRKRKNEQRQPVSIPWALLDQLDGEKRKLELDITFNELYQKF